MPRTAAQQAAKYAAKQDSTVIGSRFGALRDSMVSQQAQTAVINVNDTAAVKAVIEPLGVSTTLFSSYLAAGREFSALSRKFTVVTTGSTGTKRAQEVKDKWTTRGLTSGTVIAIAAAFGWTVT